MEKLQDKPGIYCILNTLNGKVYNGQSISIKRRVGQHINLLSKGKHANAHLQASWDKYGESNFQYFALEYCSKKQLNCAEMFWIWHHKSYERWDGKTMIQNSKDGYNLTPGGDSLNTEEHKNKLSNSQKGKKISDDTKNKMGIAAKNRWIKYRVNSGLCIEGEEEMRSKMTDEDRRQERYLAYEILTDYLRI